MPPGIEAPEDASDAEVAVDGVPLAPVLGLEKGRSTSGQFVVYCDDLRLRGAFSIFAEELKGEFLALLRRGDEWRYPIVIQVRMPAQRVVERGARDAVRCRIEQIEGGGYRFLVMAEVSGRFTRAEFERELMRALLAERMLRAHATLPPRRAEQGPILPAWLHAGVLEALAVRRSLQGSGLFASILEGGHLLEIDAVLRGDPEGMDSVSAAVFRASAGALVLALQAQPSGAERFEWMLEQMPVFAGTPREMLARFFPGFRLSRHSLTKWWALEVARLSRPTVFEALGAAETDAALGAALAIRVPEPASAAEGVLMAAAADPADAGEGEAAADGDAGEGGWWRRLFRRSRTDDAGGGREESGAEPEEAPASEVDAGAAAVATGEPGASADGFGVPESWWALLELDEPVRRAALRSNQAALASLEQRGHPLFLPIVQGYRRLFERLAEGKRKDLEEGCRELEDQRAGVVARLGAIEDYLDWYEATQRDHASGEFDAYFETLREFESAPGVRRGDAISRYLDSLEEELR